ncbi:hypothetical protein ACDX78_02140 [Virgibacillus oceani]
MTFYKNDQIVGKHASIKEPSDEEMKNMLIEFEATHAKLEQEARLIRETDINFQPA